jgi:glutamate synthase domain-containing protein 3
MRGGRIFIQGNAGYRTGIHMKQYDQTCPLIVVGGSAGSFLGEYQAGGVIIVLGLEDDSFPAGHFIAAGMHGGKIFLRTEQPLRRVSPAASVHQAQQEELEEIQSYLQEFSGLFGVPMGTLLAKPFFLLTPNARNPYEQLYTEN